MLRRLRIEPAVVVAAVAAAVVAIVQLRRGVLQILDTGSYVSGADAFRHGHPFTSTLAPSFSNFSAVEFLQRDGRLPFVDFPVGFVTIGGVLGLALGARLALGVVVVVATAALAAAVVIGPSRPRHSATPWVRAVFAVGLVALPVYRLVVQGVLSEPLFCALLVALAAAVVRYRADGSARAGMVVCGAALGLVRFLGGALAVVPAIEHYRRHRDARRATGLAALCLAPTVLNVVGAGLAGGGHTATWHGIDRRDVRLVARSLAGMLDARTGDLARTLLKVGDQLPWWGVLVALVWLAAVVVAGLQYLGILRRSLLPAPAEVCLALGGVLTAAILFGVAVFDALATPDNRIMLPVGVLAACAVVWSVDVPWPRAAWAGAALALWAVVAVRPWEAAHLFSQPGRLAGAETFDDLEAAVVLSNDADGFYLATGLPSAYLPPERMALTDEPVDRAALFEQLPCALAEHAGAVVVFPNAMFGVFGQAELDDLVATGRLISYDAGGPVVYWPAASLDC